MKKYGMLLVYTLIMGIIVTACNLPRKTATPSASDLVNTAAAQTIAAFNTQLVSTGVSTPVAATPSVSITTLPTIGPENTTVVNTPTTEATKLPCNVALFIEDVTVDDGQPFPAGTKFTKTWLLKNGGSCTWTSGYTLVFANDGNSMGGPASQSLSGIPVAPGETLEVSVDLTAPTESGTYRGGWRLRDQNNETFGKFWVEIKVVETQEGEFAFADNLCSAVWKAGDEVLDCPGSQDDTDGYVVRLDNPKFENGYIDNEPAIVMEPQQVEDGIVYGVFFPIKIPEDSEFTAIIGCMTNSEDCNVRFTLKAQAEGESEDVLGEWVETSDGEITRIVIDLSEEGLGGETVTFTFMVEANGSPDEDKAFWLNPKVVEK